MTSGEERRAASGAAQSERSDDSGTRPPELFIVEMLPRIARDGLALDIAAGPGRHSLLLARAGMRVVAIDSSLSALEVLASAAREQKLDVCAVAADLGSFPMPDCTFDVIVNINFLDRELASALKRALKPGGLLLFDTFLVDHAQLGKPRNPAYLLKHGELKELLSGLDLLEYREGLVIRSDGRRSYRASALAVRHC